MKTIILLAAVSLLAVAAFAGTVNVVNPGFESQGLTTWVSPPCPTPGPGGGSAGCYSVGNIDGIGGPDWQVSAAGGNPSRAGQMYLNPGVQFSYQFGNLAAFITGPAPGVPAYNETVWQILSASVVPSMTYGLNMEIGNRAGALDPPTGNYFVGLYYGSGATWTPIFKVYPSVAIPDGGWVLFSATGTTPGDATGNLLVGMGVDSPAANGSQVWFDDVEITPEPATFALGGLGLLGIALMIRRRRA
jgi:hypothetical protein